MRRYYKFVLVLLLFIGYAHGEIFKLDDNILQKTAFKLLVPSFSLLPTLIRKYSFYDLFAIPAKKIRQCGGATSRQRDDCLQDGGNGSKSNNKDDKDLNPNKNNSSEDNNDVNVLLYQLRQITKDIKKDNIKVVLNISLEALLYYMGYSETISSNDGPFNKFFTFLKENSDDVIWVLNSNRPHCSYFSKYLDVDINKLDPVALYNFKLEEKFCLSLPDDADGDLVVFLNESLADMDNKVAHIPAPDALISGAGRHIELNRKRIGSAIIKDEIDKINDGLNKIVKLNYKQHGTNNKYTVMTGAQNTAMTGTQGTASSMKLGTKFLLRLGQSHSFMNTLSDRTLSFDDFDRFRGNWYFYWPSLALSAVTRQESSNIRVLQVLIADIGVNKGSAFRIALPHLVKNHNRDNTIVIAIGKELVDTPMLLPARESRALDDLVTVSRWNSHCVEVLKKYTGVETTEPLMSEWFVSIMPKNILHILLNFESHTGDIMHTLNNVRLGQHSKLVGTDSVDLKGLLEKLVDRMDDYDLIY